MIHFSIAHISIIIWKLLKKFYLQMHTTRIVVKKIKFKNLFLYTVHNNIYDILSLIKCNLFHILNIIILKNMQNRTKPADSIGNHSFFNKLCCINFNQGKFSIFHKNHYFLCDRLKHNRNARLEFFSQKLSVRRAL